MEQAIIFGKYQNLVGNVHMPNHDIHHKTAMIMLTAGMLHSVGPYRLYVDIARSLEEDNIPSLRFDLSGIGDSLGVGFSGKSIDRAASEASAAMDYLSSTYGIDNFIIFGLCSGADDAIQTALYDKRVRGVINLDGLGYKTLQFKLRHFSLLARKTRYPKKWLNKIRTLMGKQLAPASLALGNDIREFPKSPEQATSELQKLIKRNIFLHFIYTGGTSYYNYSNQFYDMLPEVKWKGTESTTYFPQMDHVVTLYEDRELLVRHITDKTLEMSRLISEEK